MKSALHSFTFSSGLRLNLARLFAIVSRIGMPFLFVLSLPVLAGDVYVVDTIDRPATQQLGEALRRECASCGALKYRQMNGSLRVAKRIAAELAAEEKAGRLSLVVTLGRPATRVIAEKLEHTPVIYTFVGQEIGQFARSALIVGLPTDAPLKAQLKLLRKLQPEFRSAGIVVGERNNRFQQSSESPDPEHINIYRIKDRKDIASALREAVHMNDALILIRDPMVVNNDTIKFVMQHTLENGRHTIAYSRSLVDMGLAAALVPKPEAFGRLLGKSIQNYMDHGVLEVVPAVEADYLVHTNARVLEQLNRIGRPLTTANLRVQK